VSAPPLNAGVEGPAHILVVDDDARIRDLLKRFLSRNGYLVTVARDAGHASRLLQSLAFDMLVIDVMMPGEDGFSLTRRIRNEIDTPILLLTARGETGDRIEGLEAGADDYLPKPFEPRELLLRIGGILRRAGPPPPAEPEVRFGEFCFDLERAELRRRDEPVRPTSGEAGLLGVFALNPGVTLTRERLGHEGRLGTNPRTIDVQIARLRRKIEADPKAPRYLQTVWGAGYVLRVD